MHRIASHTCISKSKGHCPVSTCNIYRLQLGTNAIIIYVQSFNHRLCEINKYTYVVRYLFHIRM